MSYTVSELGADTNTDAQAMPTPPALGVELVTRLIRGLAPLDGRMLIVMEIARLMTADEEREVQVA